MIITLSLQSTHPEELNDELVAIGNSILAFLRTLMKPMVLQLVINNTAIVEENIKASGENKLRLNRNTDSGAIGSRNIPPYMVEEALRGINILSATIHNSNQSAGWWTDLVTGASLLGKDEHGRDRRNVPEMLALIHSEVSEALEGYRKSCMDDHLPHRTMFEVELADTFIRIFDLAGGHALDLGGAIREKLEYNAQRADHKVENRVLNGGKKC